MRARLSFLLLLFSGLALAETQYVDDTLSITLRSGQGNSYQILRVLTSGTAMTLLEKNDKYARVRLADGLEGWVLTQYMTPRPIARDRLAQLAQRLTRLAEENKQLTQDLSALRSEKRSVEGEQKQAATAAEKLQGELEQLKGVAARPLELERQNREISKRLQELELNTRVLNEENAVLRDRTHRDWFIAGAGVLIAGLFLGLLLPKLRRKQSWNEWR
jgi:SH3 domain protein